MKFVGIYLKCTRMQAAVTNKTKMSPLSWFHSFHTGKMKGETVESGIYISEILMYLFYL